MTERLKPRVSSPQRTISSERVVAIETPRLPSFDPEAEEFDAFPPEEAPTAAISKPMLALLVHETLPRHAGPEEDTVPNRAPLPPAPEPAVIIRTQPPASPRVAFQNQVTVPPTRPRLQPIAEVTPPRPSAHPLLWVSLFVLAAAALASLFWGNLG